jgi:hypothetical protein
MERAQLYRKFSFCHGEEAGKSAMVGSDACGKEAPQGIFKINQLLISAYQFPAVYRSASPVQKPRPSRIARTPDKVVDSKRLNLKPTREMKVTA